MIVVKKALYSIFESVLSLALFYLVAMLVTIGIGVLFGSHISFADIAARALVTTVVVCLFTLYIFVQIGVRSIGKLEKPVLLILPLVLVVGLTIVLAWYSMAAEYQVTTDAMRAYLGYGISATLFFPLNYLIVLRKWGGRRPSL